MRQTRRGRRRQAALVLACALVWLVGLATSATALLAEEVDLELRIAWGGGVPRQWQATIALDRGELFAPVPIGMELDEPGSMHVDAGRLHIRQRSPRSYDGVDVHARGPLDGRLLVSIGPVDEPELARTLEISLADLVAETSAQTLDTVGNRLSIRRTPGDRLRVKLDRDRLVFAPGERFEIDVEPYLFTVQPEASVTLELRLFEGRTEREVWRADHPLRADGAGRLPEVGPLPVQLPDAEGVYDLQLSLAPWHLPTPFVRSRPLLKRMVQLVCVSPHAPVSNGVDWSEQIDFDPANPTRWDRLKQLPQLKLIPGFGQGPLGNGKAIKRTHAGRSFTELEVDAWQAFPLPLSGVGKPHIVEVEIPRDVPQTLVISIVEPDARGKVAPLGLDSGVHVSESRFEDRQGLGVHRLIFWPRTSSPLLLLSNRDSQRSAVFGRIRLLAGPDRLSPSTAAGLEAPADRRLFAAYFQKPLLAENFSSDEALDESSGRTFDDWATFYHAGLRLTEYLRHVDYNGAMICVACEGSAIYPSRLLEPTPRFDTGTFFATGQDPLRKDVLELLLRMFDREGLTLVPAVQLSSPLPRLEGLRRAGPDEFEGIDLVDVRGAPYTAGNTASGAGPRYNPLDERVQQALLEVVDELGERYAHHPAFGGVALQFGPGCHLQFPGEAWGMDRRTLERFARDLGITPPLDDVQARIRFFQAEGRLLWLSWRSQKLAELHARMQQRLAVRRRDARLYLAASGALAEEEAAYQLRPALPPRGTIDDALLGVGLNPELYRDKPGVVLLRPRQVTPLISAAAEAADVDLLWRDQLDQRFAVPTAGGLFQHQPLTNRLVSFEAVSPFGPENTHLWQAAPVSPEGAANRARFAAALAAGDVQSLFDGGSLLALGQEAALQPLIEVYRHLPAQPFQTIAAKGSAAEGSPIVVRSLALGGRTYVYAVNNSPWTTGVQIELAAPSNAAFELLGGRLQPPPRRSGEQWQWNLMLEPYELAGGVMLAERARVVDWRSEVVDARRLSEALRRGVEAVRTQAASLRTRSPVDVLHNAEFELPPNRQLVPGWVYSQDVGVDVAADGREHHRGAQSLHVRSTGGVAWVRSDAFDPPTTGRISIWVWLKTSDPRRQPPLRLAIEGRMGERVYYKYANVGAGGNAPRLSERWGDYLFQVDDLPLEGLTDLRVGFDLMGPGDVWIDDVQVFDMWFYDQERDELLKSIAVADFQLGKGRLNDCRRFLESYWPRFLERNVPPAAIVTPARTTIFDGGETSPAAGQRRTPPASPPPNANPAPPPPTMLQRMRNWLPRRILPF